MEDEEKIIEEKITDELIILEMNSHDNDENEILDISEEMEEINI